MPFLPVTGAVAGYCGLLTAGLSLTVGLRRFFTSTLFGNGGDTKGKEQVPQRLVRAQQNATEQIPIFLIVLAALENNESLPKSRLATLGAVYCAARTAHSLALASAKIPTDVRSVGFLTQMGLLISTSAILLVKSYKKL